MLDRIIRATASILAFLAGTGLLVMMVLTFLDVIGRYGFNKSIFGTAEIVEYLMILTIFSGLAFVTATNDHITVTMFDGWIERWFSGLRRWLVIVFSIAVYSLMTWELLKHGLDHWLSGKRSAVLDLPLWIMPTLGGGLSVAGLFLILGVTVRSRGHLDRVARDLSSFDTAHGRDIDTNLN